MHLQAIKVLAVLLLLTSYCFKVNAQTQAPTDQKDSQYLRDWQSANTGKYHRYQKQGGILVGSGSALFVAGAIVTIVGISMHPTKTVVYNTVTTDPGQSATKFELTVLGPLAAVSGAVLAVWGGTVLHKAHLIKVKANQLGVKLSYAPIISPINRTYGVQVALTF